MKCRYFISYMLLAVIVLTSCEDIWNRCVDGNGHHQTENRALQSFNRIEVNGNFEVQVDTGNLSSAVIEADENLLDFIITHISGNMLIIETRDGACIQPSRPIEITVTTPEVHEITLNGSGLVYCYGLEAEDFYMNLSGSGEIQCDNLLTSSATIEVEGSGYVDCHIETENLTTQLEGSGEIRLTGSCINSDHKIIGSGKIKASQITSEVCHVYISGSGMAEAYVTNALDVTIIGSGILYYSGDPAVETYISGSGKVVKR